MVCTHSSIEQHTGQYAWRGDVCIHQQDDQNHGPHSQQEEEERNEDELGVGCADSGQVVALEDIGVGLLQLHPE